MILIPYKDMFWGPGGDDFDLWVWGCIIQPIIWECIRNIFDINVNSNATLTRKCLLWNGCKNKQRNPSDTKGPFVDFLFLQMAWLGEGARLPTQEAAHTHCAHGRPTLPGEEDRHRTETEAAPVPYFHGPDSRRPPLSHLVALTKLGQGKSK